MTSVDRLTRETQARVGLKQLLRQGALTPASVLACPDLVELGMSAGQRPEDAAVVVSAAVTRAVSRIEDAEAARHLLALGPKADRQSLTKRRIAAASVVGVTPDSFRVRREQRIINELAREILLEVNQRRGAAARPPGARATLDSERHCPYCGSRFRLANCPVVATSPAQAPDQGHRDHAGSDVWVRSRIDGVARFLIGRPPSTDRSGRAVGHALPSPWELAAGVVSLGERPARACPVCCHPLPPTIDATQPYVVAIAGLVAASKTSTVLALLHGITQAGPEPVGLKSVSVAETSFFEYQTDIRAYGYGDLATATEPGLQTPVELAAKSDHDAPVTVLIQDGAGEDFANPYRRLRHLPLVPWADAIVFVYDPEQAPSFRQQRSDAEILSLPRGDQSVLLSGIRDDLEVRTAGNPPGGVYPDPQLFVALSKGDLLGWDASRASAASEQDIRAAIAAIGDKAFLHATERWDAAQWGAIAPKPPGGAPPFGVLELFRAVLAPIRNERC
jgi:hypothetical protein